MNPYHHALSSAQKFGGQPEDYLELHRWFDESKSFMPDFRHRALRHHAEGIFLAERLFGVTLTNSAGRVIPTRFIGEQHVKEDLGRIPTVQDWLECITPQPWMMKVAKTEADLTSHGDDPSEAAASGEEVSRFRNYHECPRCGNSWTDEWSATCDDDCPRCGARHISPTSTEDVALSPPAKRAGSSISVGQLITRLKQLAEQSPWGMETSVCLSRPDMDYEVLLPPVLDHDADGAVVLLRLARP